MDIGEEKRILIADDPAAPAEAPVIEPAAPEVPVETPTEPVPV